ncbi:unnamed protein product [Pylaiella littoralis]
MASALVPQSYRVIVRRSAVDISYAYQAFFVAGFIMFVIFFAYYEVWTMFGTSLLSLSLMTFLIVAKVRTEGLPALLTATAPTAGVGDSEGDSDERRKRSSRRATAGSKSTSGAGGGAIGNSTEVQPLMSSW